MNYSFTTEKEILKADTEVILYSGNVATYTFTFRFDTHWDGLSGIAVFTKGGVTYNVVIDNDMLVVPHEILETAGMCQFGIYAVTKDDNAKRISSCRLLFEVKPGAYTNGEAPKPPTPDVWESLFRRSIPTIKDGFWHIYNPLTESFESTGISAVGGTPQKGVDYFDGEDGVSPAHEWNGTVLTITSASGTSSADLKGSKGEKGERGYSGLVSKVTEAATEGEITVNANELKEIPTLTGETTILLGEAVEGYDNEWTFNIVQGDTAQILNGLSNVHWGLGIAPTFSENTTTQCRLYYIGEALCGEWICL